MRIHIHPSQPTKTKANPAPAFQLRRYAYAWTAKLSLSILTDFEEFVVYDTHVPPAVTDRPSRARILYLRYDEYETRWQEFRSIFSPESIRQGNFDKYVRSTTKIRGTTQVDDAFLGELRNGGLT